MTTPEPCPSIHYRRRWYYVLWGALLLLSAAAWVLWELPAGTFQGTLLVHIQLRHAPPGVQVQTWSGPEASWHGSIGNGPGSAAIPIPEGASVTLPPFRLPVAWRRWVPRDFIPRRTWDLVVLRFAAPGAPPRFLALPCARDIRIGTLRARGKLILTITYSWNDLGTDASAPVRIP